MIISVSKINFTNVIEAKKNLFVYIHIIISIIFYPSFFKTIFKDIIAKILIEKLLSFYVCLVAYIFSATIALKPKTLPNTA